MESEEDLYHQEMNNSTHDNPANTTSSGSESCAVKQKLMFEPEIQTLFSVLYGSIGFLGIISNIGMIYIIVRKRVMWTSTNVYICNMALSDITMCLTAIPLTPWTAFKGVWHFGKIGCALLPACQGASVYISSLSLAAIAVDRYFLVMYPASRGNQKQVDSDAMKRALFIVLAIDVVSLLFMAPYSFNMEHTEYETGAVCVEKLTGPVRRVYGLLVVLTQLFIPIGVSAFAYWRIMAVLKKHSVGTLTRKNLKKQMEERARNERRTKTLIAILGLFVLCWLPLDLINLIEDMGFKLYCWAYYYFLFFCFHVLACSSVCINPIMYGWMNEMFRKEISDIVPNKMPGRNVVRSLTRGSQGSEVGLTVRNGHTSITNVLEISLVVGKKKEVEETAM